MKPIRLLTTILCAATLLTSCNKKDNLGGPSATDGPSVRLTLGGSAAPGVQTAKSAAGPITRSSGDDSTPGTTVAEEAEKSVSDLRAVLFSTKNGFYKTVEAKPDATNGGYTFIVEQDDTYDVWLVANADETLRTALESIPAGTKPDDGTNGLGAVIATQASDADNAFLMLSTEAERVTTQISQTKNIGEIHMRRLSVRIDIINAAEGITVNKVTFNNRAKQSYLQTPNVMPTEAEWFENKEYTVSLTGSKDSPTKYEHEIYTYENYTQKGGTTIPTLTLEYTEGGQSKTHTVEFTDANAPAGTPLALKRNYLYRITLNKVYQLGFQMEVIDWEAGETFDVPDLPLDGESQAALNAKLKVNMFTEYNVKSADLATKTVNSFYDKLAVSFDDCPTDSYFTYTELQDAGLTAADAVLTDGQGNKYRLPTEGELNLLLPMYTETADMPDIDGKKGRYHPWWNDNTSTSTAFVMVTDEFTETIYLKNGADHYPDKTTNTAETDGDYRLVGESQLRLGALTETVHYYTAEPDVPEKGNYNIHPVYGIRFKGTSQYAAYRWESCQINDNPLERYLSIKIKALPEDSKLTVDDLVGNNSFWAEDCIEFKFPASGYYGPSVTPDGTNDNISYRGVYGFCWSSSLWDGGTRGRFLGFYLGDAGVNHYVLGCRYPLRLVKVE